MPPTARSWWRQGTLLSEHGAMGDHLGLVLPGGNAGPYTAPLLIPWLALEETGAKVAVVDYPDFRPPSLERQGRRCLRHVRVGPGRRATCIRQLVQGDLHRQVSR